MKHLSNVRESRHIIVGFLILIASLFRFRNAPVGRHAIRSACGKAIRNPSSRSLLLTFAVLFSATGWLMTGGATADKASAVSSVKTTETSVLSAARAGEELHKAAAPVAKQAARPEPAAVAAKPSAPAAPKAPKAMSLLRNKDGKLAMYYYVDTKDAYRSLTKNGQHISLIAPQSYHVDRWGYLNGKMDPRMLAYAKKNNIAVMPLITNKDFSSTVAHDLLVSPWKRTRLINAMLATAKRNDIAGFQVDFEMVKSKDRAYLTAFMREMQWRFHKEGKITSIAVLSKWNDRINPVYDYAALGKYTDFVTLMTYDQHYRGSAPGPIAGEPWVENVLKYAKTKIPAEKLVLGVPFYYRQWGGAHKTGRYNEAAYRAKQFKRPVWFNWEHKSPHYVYWAGGRWRNVWFEDSRSFSHKMKMMNRHNMMGFAAWRIGQEDPETWRLLPKMTKVRKQIQ